VEPEHTEANMVRVSLTEVLKALQNQRTFYVNKRKVAMKKKAPGLAESYSTDIRMVDGQIALLEAGPKNQMFWIPLREAHNWGFGLMPNGRWPKL